MNQIQKRDSTFDIFKLGAVFLVILLHTNNQSTVGQYIAVLTRIAVPLFFLISGYFYDQLSAEKQRRQIGKVLKLLICATLFYIVWDIFYAMLCGENIQHFFQNSCTVQNLVLFLLVNESPFATHLWYLSALLYALLIMKLCSAPKARTVLFVLAPALLAGCLVLGAYSYALFRIRVYYIFTRNFLFTALPFLCIGRILYTKKTVIQEKLPVSVVALCIAFGIAASFLEKYLLDKSFCATYGDIYIGTVIASIGILIMGIKYPYIAENSRIAQLGRTQTVNIFIYHQVFNYLFTGIAYQTGTYNTYIPFASFAVFFTTVGFVLLCNAISVLFAPHKNIHH